MSAIDLPHARRLAYGVVLGQAGVTLMIALGLWAIAGRGAAFSALAGAAIALVTTAYSRRVALVPQRSLNAALGRVLTGELIKVLSTVILFVAATRVPRVVWWALLTGYAVALATGWWQSAKPAAGSRVRAAQSAAMSRLG